jgi:hypothetical protein
VRLNSDRIEVGRVLLRGQVIPVSDIARIIRRQVLVGSQNYASRSKSVQWTPQWQVFVEFRDDTIKPLGWDESLMQSWGYTSQGFWSMLVAAYSRQVKCEVISLS